MRQNILLTGVSSGLGLETARILLADGKQVFGLSRQTSLGLDQLLVQYPDQFHWKAVDLNQHEQLKSSIFQQLIPKGTPLHGFINNAAIAYDDLITNLQVDRLTQLFAVNVLSPMLVTKWVIRNMILHQQRGSIIHLSSISAHTGYKGLSMYAATKGALEAFSKNTAREWGTRGIRSNCVVAGFMETAMSAGLSDDQKARIYKRTSLKQATELASVAETIAFLLTAGASSITGQAIVVDSGTI